MTPSAVIGMGNPQPTSSGNPAGLYNSISSQGNSKLAGVEQSQQPIQQNPAEAAIADFGKAFESVQSLLEDPNYSFASKEADLVKRALQNWLEVVVTGLSVQTQGGESLQMPGATPPSY